jgi:hypothetical protein
MKLYASARYNISNKNWEMRGMRVVLSQWGVYSSPAWNLKAYQFGTSVA